MEEYEHIIEFSFNSRQNRFVVRFLDGKVYALDIVDLPQKMQTKKPIWEEAYLSTQKNALIMQAGKEVREIPSHMIHSKGKEL